jgi:hypothetical protein
MQHLGHMKELDLMEQEDGWLKLSVVSWTLKAEQKHVLISFFNELKVPM